MNFQENDVANKIPMNLPHYHYPFYHSSLDVWVGISEGERMWQRKWSEERGRGHPITPLSFSSHWLPPFPLSTLMPLSKAPSHKLQGHGVEAPAPMLCSAAFPASHLLWFCEERRV